jgi:integrative and conjugative element protein (TIGR02256 family)
LNHFAKFQQHDDRRSLEAGGQLFATFTEDVVEISIATGPRALDRRSRHLYLPDRPSEQMEIDEMHKAGLHFVGDWHTHPEETPTPSSSDIRTIKDAVIKSRHHLHGFILVIVGTGRFPGGLYISFNTTDTHLRLNAK